MLPESVAPQNEAPEQAQGGLAALAVHLGGMLAGRETGAVLVWSRPMFAAHEVHLAVESVTTGPEGELAIQFTDDPRGGPLRLYGPQEIVLDEHGLRVRSAARIEWGELIAEWLPPGWVRLSAQGRTSEFEVGRREALHLEPALGASWFAGFDAGNEETKE